MSRRFVWKTFLASMRLSMFLTLVLVDRMLRFKRRWI